jgi:hypothetical protein
MVSFACLVVVLEITGGSPPLAGNESIPFRIGDHNIFQDFGAISGMKLNLPKTVIIPLWPQDVSAIKNKILVVAPDWAAVEVAGSSIYLGFATGPRKGDSSWQKANLKFENRICLWGSQALGLQYAAMTYNIYAVPVLAYVAQLEEPPADTYRIEECGLAKSAKGPFKWASKDDLWYLKECYGQARSFHSVRVMAWASKVRVATLENMRRRGATIEARAKELDDFLHTSEYLGRRTVWRDWYAKSHILILAKAVNELAGIGLQISEITKGITGETRLPSEPDAVKVFKARFQKSVAKRISDFRRPDGEDRVRTKLVRWHLQGPAAHVARKVYGRLSGLSGLVAPRVAAACFSAIWNRWTTARRFQKRGMAQNFCVLGCGDGAEDSIEHYSRCQAVRTTGAKFLRLWLDTSLETFLLADARLQDHDSLVCVAVLIYATYRATNRFRPLGGTDFQTASDALEQFCKRAVEGHPPSQRIVDNRWHVKGKEHCHKRRRLAAVTRDEAATTSFRPGGELGPWLQ